MTAFVDHKRAFTLALHLSFQLKELQEQTLRFLTDIFASRDFKVKPRHFSNYQRCPAQRH
uniref:Uncharacterized protein n=1 Tax=Anguilla anguilla TaxID=7936 RepID=A0A0E9UF43_ANGAN